jgi:hypothetical protein
LQILEPLAVRKQDWITPTERRPQTIPMQTPNDRIRNDEPSRANTVAIEQTSEVLGEAVTNPDGRRPGTGVDVDADGVDHSALDSGLWLSQTRKLERRARPKAWCREPRAESLKPVS